MQSGAHFRGDARARIQTRHSIRSGGQPRRGRRQGAARHGHGGGARGGRVRRRVRRHRLRRDHRRLRLDLHRRRGGRGRRRRSGHQIRPQLCQDDQQSDARVTRVHFIFVVEFHRSSGH